MKRRYQVFVSSTFADLQEERRKLLHTLIELGCFPSGMEFFPAANANALAHIKSLIDDSDYYVLVVGGRYGSLTPEGISYTQAEYEYAVEQKPVLVFLHEDPDALPVRRSELNPEARRKLQEFRLVLQDRHLCKFWQSADGLASVVASSLAAAFEADPGEGWVRPKAIEGVPVRRASGFEVVRHSEVLRLQEGGFENDLALTIRATHPGLEVFYRQVAGTGGTNFVDAQVLSSTATLLRPMISAGSEYRYWVHLGRQLLLGEEAYVEIRERYAENMRDPESMHAYTVNHGVELLELIVEYPSYRVPSSARWREYRADPETGDVLDGGELEVQPVGGTLQFRRMNPQVGHAFAIEWREEVPPV